MYQTKKSAADEYVKKGYFDEAINTYNSMLNLNPKDAQIHLDIAKTLTYENKFEEAIPHLEMYLKTNPDDIEYVTLLGECYKKIGRFAKSIELFKNALAQDPKYDYANRNLLDAQNLYLQWIDPKRARTERYNHAVKTLQEAVNIAKNFLPSGFTDDMKDITVCFDKTAVLGGRSNIAQYEHSLRKISVSDDYVYADPKFVATYLIHEFIHGKDNDAYTSVREEQDAYRIQAEYWVKNVKDIHDPEMDFVAELYKQSPKVLDAKVADIYRTRDPYIQETSKNHPVTAVSKSFFSSLFDKQPEAPIKPLKAYDIIV